MQICKWEEIHNEAFILIEDMRVMLTNKKLGVITPNRPMHDAFNQELRREIPYDFEALGETV